MLPTSSTTPSAPEDARLRAVAMAVTDAVIAADAAGTIIAWTGAAERMLGWTAEEAVGRPLTLVIPERFRTAHVAGFDRVASGGPTSLVGRTTVELEACRRDGSELPVELSLGQGEQDGVPVFVGVLRDISVRREEQERLRRAEELFRMAFEHAPIGVTMTLPDGRYLKANQAFREMVGFSDEELAERTFVSLTHPDDVAGDQEMRERLEAGLDRARLEKRYVRRDGSTLWVQIDVSVVRDGEGRLVHYLTHVQDITERRSVAERLQRSNAELEHFASTASHDLNEPLRLVDGFLRLLERRAGDKLDEQELGFVVEARGASRRMRELVDALLGYARAGTAEAQVRRVESADVAHEALMGLHAVVDERRAAVEVDPRLPPVEADPALLRQVFQNLLSNALKFADCEEPRVRVSAERGEDGWTFSVADNGPGIPAADRDRVFEMFARAGGADRAAGAGIGLASTQRAVARHGGRIWVQDAPGGGADVRFTLPGA